MAPKKTILEFEAKAIGFEKIETELNGVIREITRTIQISSVLKQEFEGSAKSTNKFASNLNLLKNEADSTEGKLSSFTGKLSDVSQVISKVSSELKGLYNEYAVAGANSLRLKEGFEELEGGSEKAAIQLELLQKAASGNLPDNELIKLSNSVRKLGFDSEQTVKIIDLAERKIGLFGGDLQASTDALTNFLQTGDRKAANSLNLSLDKISESLVNVSGYTLENVKALDEQERAQLLSIATFEDYGSTIDIIKGKQQDENDEILNLKSEYGNLETKYQEVVANALAPFSKELGNSSDTTKNVLFVSDKLIGKLGEYLPALILAQGAFQGLGAAIYASLGPASAAAGAIILIASLISEVVSELELTSKWMDRVAQQKVDNLIEPHPLINPTVTSFQQQDVLGGYNPKIELTKIETIETLGFDPLNPNPQKVEQYGPHMTELQKKQFEEKKLRDENKKGYNTKSGHRTGNIKEIQAEIDPLDKLLKLLREEIQLRELVGSEGITNEEALIKLQQNAALIEGASNEKRIKYFQFERQLKDEIKKEHETELDKQIEIIQELQKKLELNKNLKGAEQEINRELDEAIKRRDEILGIINATAKSTEERIAATQNIDSDISHTQDAIKYLEEKLLLNKGNKKVQQEINELLDEQRDKLDDLIKESKTAAEGQSVINAQFLEAVSLSGAEIFESTLMNGVQSALRGAFGGEANSIFEMFLQKMAGRIVETFAGLLENAIIKFFINLFSSFLPGIGSVVGGIFGGSISGGASMAGAVSGSMAPLIGSGGTLSNLISGSSYANVQVREVPYVASTAIDGRNIKLILERTSNIDNTRAS